MNRSQDFRRSDPGWSVRPGELRARSRTREYLRGLSLRDHAESYEGTQAQAAELEMSESRYLAGWDEERVRSVLDHYESQSDEEAVAEDEAAWDSTAHPRWKPRSDSRKPSAH